MSGPFTRALEFTLRWEGGVSLHPSDAGGLTAYGITAETWRRWLDRQGKRLRPVTESTEMEREALYYELFWDKARCYLMPPPLAIAVFDCAVNLGPERAREIVQAVLGVKIDGMIGPVTVAAINAADPKATAANVTMARLGYYISRVAVRSQNRDFLKGWQARCHDLLREIGA